MCVCIYGERERKMEEDWNGWPFLSPEDLPNPGIQPRSALQVVSCIADGSFTTSAPWKPTVYFNLNNSCLSALFIPLTFLENFEK